MSVALMPKARITARDLSSGAWWPWATTSLTLGGFVAAVVLAPKGGSSATGALAWLLFVGSAVHVASTAWLFTLSDVRGHALERSGRYVYAPAVLVVAGTAAAALLNPQRLQYVLIGFFAWQFFHFTKQNLGLAALAASAEGIPPLRRNERRCLMAAGLCGIAGLLARPALLQLSVVVRSLQVFVAFRILFIVLVVAGMVLLVRRGGQHSFGFAAVYVTALLFSAPIFVFSSPYAAIGGMTIAHGLQYLLLVGLVAAGDRQHAGHAGAMTSLFGVAIVGGAALAALSHLHRAATASPRFLFGLYLGLVAAHFVVDAGLWRLRDPFARAWLSARVPSLVPPAAQHRRPMDRRPI